VSHPDRVEMTLWLPITGDKLPINEEKAAIKPSSEGKTDDKITDNPSSTPQVPLKFKI